jgi:hypothetical protein
MKQLTRELLVTAKVAQGWQGDFEQKVDELISIVSKVDNEEQVRGAGELLDVYQKKSHKPRKSKRKKQPANSSNSRPFEFLVFRN